jgi:hypothetical protein
MSLLNGYSYKTVKANIAALVKEGTPKDKASAVAYAAARRCYRSRYPQGMFPAWLAPRNPYESLRSKDCRPCASNEYAKKAQPGYLPHKKNPVPPSKKVQLREAKKLFSDFSGHDGEIIDTIDKPGLPDVMLVVGDIDFIGYTTVRDNVIEKYIHKFKKNCRPLFCVSHDGKQIYLLGGSYDFTERGIVDKT